MKCICKNCTQVVNNTIWTETENKYQIKIRQDIQQFLTANSGGFPIKDIIIVDGEEYEVRVFLSLDSNDKNYYIEKPLNYFLENTKGKIVPIGIDSGDNYYCVNNENGKVYYWSAGENQYYCISESLEAFILKF
jgi:hypothetical protein